MRLVTIQNASVANGQNIVWQNLNLNIEAKDFIAVLGPNGAGKTTFLNSILGKVSLQTGHITKKESLTIGYLSQFGDIETNIPMRSFDLVKLNLPAGIKRKNTKIIVEDAISKTAGKEVIYSQYNDISGGQKKKVKVAQMLVRNPELILCDEPLANLDFKSKKNITELIYQAAQKLQAATLFVTHDLNVVLPYCNKILYIAEGKYLFDTPDRVLRSERLSALYGTPITVVEAAGKKIIVAEEEV